MLDPVQREALTAARDGSVAVSGGPGTGKTRLANALVADAVSRGLTCLLVGDDAGLDSARGLGGTAPLHPFLSARTGVSFAAQRGTGVLTDPVTLRASLYPAEADLARRLLQRARDIQAEHRFEIPEVSAAAVRRMPSARTMALIGVTCADAAIVADAVWGGNARPGRTMGEVVSALKGETLATPGEEEALSAALGGAAYENLIETLGREIDEATEANAGLADLRRTLDPWAWGTALATVGDLQASLAARAVAFSNAANLIREHGTIDAASRSCPAGDNAKVALTNYQRMFPGIDGREAETAIRRFSHREEGRADALTPFLGTHAATRIAKVEAAVDRPESRTDGIERLERLRAVRDASARLADLFSDLAQALPVAALSVVHGKPLDDVRASVAFAREENERTRALREMAGVRSAFSRTGFGDVMALGSDFEDLLAASVDLEDAPRAEPESPRTLDVYLSPDRSAPDVDHAWPSSVRRWRPAQAGLPVDGARFDVVVVDDAIAMDETEIAALRRIAPVVHLVGVERGHGIDLPIPHRSRSAALTNLGRPAAERGWAGGPDGAGIIVRTVPPGVEIRDALMTSLVAVRSVGMQAVDALDGQGTGDVVVLAMDKVTETDVVAAGARAKSAVLVLARECSWTAPEMPLADVPEDEQVLIASGWELVANAEDGRVYSKGERSAIVTDEPDGFGVVGETVAERVARLSAVGWSPVVAWRGSPRGADDMLRLVERNAVENGVLIELELATFPLPRPKAARVAPSLAPIPEPMAVTKGKVDAVALPAMRVAPAATKPAADRKLAFEDIPASPHRQGSFQDVVWKLKWVREEVLLPVNPTLDACLLTDERIAHLIRMGIDEEGMWQARFRGAVIRGADPSQLAIRDVVMDVVSLMPRRGIANQTATMVAAVPFERRPALDGAVIQAHVALAQTVDETPRMGM